MQHHPFPKADPERIPNKVPPSDVSASEKCSRTLPEIALWFQVLHWFDVWVLQLCMLFLQPPKMGGWPWLEPGRFITRLGFQRCAKWWLKRCTCGRPAQVTVTYCRSCELLAGVLLGEGLLGNQVRIDFTRLERVDSSEGLSPRWLNEFLTEIMENLMEAHKCFS